MICQVLHPGQLATVQDGGRVGHQAEGIPVSGAMDRLSLRVANLLVGNDDEAAGLECTLVGPTLRFDEHTLIALGGADLGVTAGGVPLPLWRPISIPAGTTVNAASAVRGCRGYVAIAGGIDVPEVLGSRSTYLRASFGGFEGRALRRGDRLPLGTPTELGRRISDEMTRDRGRDRVTVARWGASASLIPFHSTSSGVRLIEGEHMRLLTTDSVERLWSTDFRVATQSDRMGYRLENGGLPLTLSEPRELLSEAVAFGTVQLPPGGNPIVLMADRQTTGGYPRIGEVASVDLALVAQLKPGDRLRFRPISLDEAQRLYLAREDNIRQARAAIALHHH